jgi:cbb3-type cytochrome oxidase maturation protein
MSVIILLIIFSLILALGFLIAFIWSVRSNQMEDDYTPSVRILFENELLDKQDKQEHTNKKI